MDDRPSLLTSIVAWLREGYPQGVPQGDYVPLIALLRRQLTEEEIRKVAVTLAVDADSGPVDRVDIGVEVSKVTDQLPDEREIDRVRATLEAAGWPFDDAPHRPPRDEPEDTP